MTNPGDTMIDVHVQSDNTCDLAHGWSDLDLGHSFVEVETLPESDRTRFTISPSAHKSLLSRLLGENQRRSGDSVKPGETRDPASSRKGSVENHADAQLLL